jgi:hypothetical protein
VQEEDYETNPHLRALRNLDYSDDYGPDELARDCKERGNQAFKQGPKFYGNALKFYNDALRHVANAPPCEEMTELESVVHANLAAIFVARRKVQYALDECAQALQLWPRNVKAAFRGAKCANQLGRYTQARDLSQAGLAVDAGSAPLEKQRAAAQAGLLKVARHREAAAAARDTEVGHLVAMRAACRERGIQVGPPLFVRMRRGDDRPHVTEDGCMHWPLLLLYPQSGQSDYIQSWPEVENMAALLGTVLPVQGGLPWDREGAYLPTNVDIFYQAFAVQAAPLHLAWEGWLPALPSTPSGDTQEAEAASAPPSTSGVPPTAPPHWVRVPLHAPLMLALVQGNFVVPEIPVLHIVPRGTAWAKAWRAEALRGMKAVEFPQLQVPDFNAAATA